MMATGQIPEVVPRLMNTWIQPHSSTYTIMYVMKLANPIVKNLNSDSERWTSTVPVHRSAKSFVTPLKNLLVRVTAFLE